MMSTDEQAWKPYEDPSPLVMNLENKKLFKSTMQITVKEMKYRKILNEQMGLAKIEKMIEVCCGDKAAEFMFNQGMVAPDSPAAKHIKHLTNTEKIEAMRRFFNDAANGEHIAQVFDIPRQSITELVAFMNAGKFSIVKEVKPVKTAKPAKTPAEKPAKTTKPAKKVVEKPAKPTKPVKKQK